MKKLFFSTFTFLLCSPLLGQTIDQLAGRVVDLNNKGIEGVEVRLESAGDLKYTDQDGNFEFNGVFIMAEPLYSFELYKEGYVTVSKSDDKKVIFASGNIGNIIMKENAEKYLWITVMDSNKMEFLQDVEIEILGKQEKTNKNGKVKFDLSGLGKTTTIVTFQKLCYKDLIKQINTTGEEIVNLTNICNKLSGTIVNLNNKGIEGVKVQLENLGHFTYSDQDGNFEITGDFKMSESYYSFLLFKEGYTTAGKSNEKKVVYTSGNIGNIIMKENTEQYLWITVVDAKDMQFLKDVEIDILGRQEKTNKSGKARFDLSGIDKNTVNASFMKNCYKDELNQLNTSGEAIIKLIYTCDSNSNIRPKKQEDLTTDIVGIYKVKSHFLNFNMGLDLDREYEIEIKKKNNNTVTILDKVDMIFLKIPISYDVELSKSNDLLLFAIPQQTDVNQTVKGTGHSTHAAHGEFSKKTDKIDFSYVVSDVSANRKYNIVGFKKD